MFAVQQGRPTIIPKDLAQSRRSAMARSPEIENVSRELASLARAKLEQDGRLSVRQREILRRALAMAGKLLGWSTAAVSNGESVAAASKDVMRMAKKGAKFLERDLAEELARKRTEVRQLEEIAAYARELADDPNATYATEISYGYTARDASKTLVTRREVVTVNDSEEARGAAGSIEKSLPGRGKLAAQMIVEIERQQDQLDSMKQTLPAFVQSSRHLLGEVITSL